ncbi:MAG TPA: transglutaminase-like domain-containing protein, partial [Candidatus Cybelea sp.]|nr:transglutaminase-like domain-containing protein [Candidatus Cybelea sp.]
DLAPPAEFPFTTHACFTAFPVLEDILFIRGETNTLKFDGLGAENGSNCEGGLYWARQQPEVYKWEPMEPSPADFSPVLCVGDGMATWNGEAAKYLEKLGEYLQLDDAGRELAAQLVKNASGESEKIMKLARYVQTNYTYKALEFGRRARLPHKTAEIVRNHYGDCKDHSLLLQQLLEASGIPARLALVKTQGKVQKELPSLDQFDHMVVYLPAFQNGFFLDCTDKGSDLTQTPPLGLGGKEALVLDPAQARFVAIPDYPAGCTKLRLQRDVRITNGTDVVVHEVLSLKGCNGSALRSYFKSLQPVGRRQFVEGQLNRKSGELTGFQLQNLEDTQAPLTFEMDYIMKRQFHLAGNQLVGKLPDVWEQVYASAEPIDPRITPFELRYPIDVESTITLATPDGYRAPALQDFRQNVPMSFASSRCEAQKNGSGLKIDYKLQRRSGQFAPAEYGPYCDNMVKALGPLEQTVAFTKKP